MSQQDENQALRELIAQLTRRVYQLELRLGSAIVATPPGAQAPMPPPADAAGEQAMGAALPSQAPDLQPPGLPRPAEAPPGAIAAPALPEPLERRIGSRWLNRVGVVAVLIGVSYFLKLAMDSGWIGPGVRVLIGCAAGVGLCLWSERFRRPASLAFSYSLKAVGAGILYLSLWASYQLYHLLPGTIAFLAMIVVTASVAGLALLQDAELLAALSLLGGLLTPILCATGENHEAALFCYLLLLSLGALLLARVKPWPRLLLGTFAGTALLAAAWFNAFYSNALFGETQLFFSLLFVLFAVAPLVVLWRAKGGAVERFLRVLLAALNGALYFAALDAQLRLAAGAEQTREAGYALGLAAFYAGLGIALERRAAETLAADRPRPADHGSRGLRLDAMAHYALAITFCSIGLALRLHQHWLTLAWLVEAALVFWAGERTAHPLVKKFAVAVLALGLVRLVVVDLAAWGEQPPILNPRLATFAVAIAALLWTIWLDARSPQRAVLGRAAPGRRSDAALLAAGVVAVNLLALLAIGLEIHDAFAAALRTALGLQHGPPQGIATLVPYSAFGAAERARQGFVILRSFSYSALLMLYGAGLMWLGFLRRSALLRWQAILLFAAAILKVFCIDVWELERGWRVLSFIVLGALLLSISYAYQRDWLRIQPPRPE